MMMPKELSGSHWLPVSTLSILKEYMTNMFTEHEDCFMDTPRLSTLQAMLLLLKGREAAPRRGYYFRSWMTVKKLVTFALELKLDKHYSEHQVPGGRCTSDPTECLIKTRLWQIIFTCEMMIGGPQGLYRAATNIGSMLTYNRPDGHAGKAIHCRPHPAEAYTWSR